MTESQYIAETAALWKERFRKHHATSSFNPAMRPDGTITAPCVIEWREPGTCINGVRFVMSGSYLCCIGDIGDSVLQWSEVITPRFLATCDFHYWFGKKRAWPGGKDDWKYWNPKVANQYALDQANEFEDGDTPSWFDAIIDAEGDREQFAEAADLVHYDETEMAVEIRDAGLVPDCQAIAQWVGLQMALHKLGIRKEAL